MNLARRQHRLQKHPDTAINVHKGMQLKARWKKQACRKSANRVAIYNAGLSKAIAKGHADHQLIHILVPKKCWGPTGFRHRLVQCTTCTSCGRTARGKVRWRMIERKCDAELHPLERWARRNLLNELIEARDDQTDFGSFGTAGERARDALRLLEAAAGEDKGTPTPCSPSRFMGRVGRP